LTASLALVAAQTTAVGTFAGRHVLAELLGVHASLLDDEPFLRAALTSAVRACGATICEVVSKRFEPHGVTVLVLLAESHASLHTYPERESIFLDVFTCGEGADPAVAVDSLATVLRPRQVHRQELRRGRA
jgi:S-adenosylmethionine decarboxylase